MPRRSPRLALKATTKKRSRESFEEYESVVEEEYNPQSSDSDEYESDDSAGSGIDTLSDELTELETYKCPISNDEHSNTDSSCGPPKKRRKINRGGFSTKAKALQTLQFIEGRDVSYQRNMVASFLCGARSILKKAQTKEKKGNINDAIDIFTKWTNEYELNKDKIENFDHLQLDIIKQYLGLVDFYNMEQRKREEMELDTLDVFNIDKTYFHVLDGLNGEIRALRITKQDGDDISWDIVRNNKLLELKKELIKYDIRCDGRMKTLDDCLLYYKRGKLKGLPSRLHLQMIMYGYSPNKCLIKKLAKQVKQMLTEITKGYI